MSRTFVLGSHCALYYVPNTTRIATAGDTQWPVAWASALTRATTSNLVLVSNIGDVNLELGGNIVEISTRGGNGWKQSINALKNGDITFQMVWNPDNVICTDFMRANVSGCPIAVLALDGRLKFETDEGGTRIQADPVAYCSTASNVTGLWADFMCTITMSQPLNNVVMADISLTPTLGQFAPEYVSYPVAVMDLDG